MKLKLLTCIFILISIKFFGQDKDSLLAVIKNYKFNDTIQCQRILDFIELEDDENIWMTYNEKLLDLANQKLKLKINDDEKRRYQTFIGQYYINKSFFYSSKDDQTFYESFKYNFKAIEFFKSANNKKALAEGYHNIGVNYLNIKKPSIAITYFNKALVIYKSTGENKYLASLYSDFGSTYNEFGMNDKAIDYFIKSLKISDKNNDINSKQRTYEQIIHVLISQNDYEKALFYSFETLNFNKSKNNFSELAQSYGNLSYIYLNLKKYDLMEKYADLCIYYGIKYNKNISVANAYLSLADYHFYIKKNDLAGKYYKLALQYASKGKLEPYYSRSLVSTSNFLLANNQILSAEKIGVLAFNNATKSNNIELILLTAGNLKKIFKAKKNDTKALEFAELEINMNDSLNKLSAKNSAIKSLFKYETEKKEAQITALAKDKKIATLESKRQKAIALILGIGIISILLTSYFLFNRFKIKKQNELLKSKLVEAEKTIEAEKKATESELKALKSQMNPHFIFNALSSIQDQFMYGDKVIANEQMGNFTYLTRQILNVSGKKQILLATEIDILSKYLELEKMRFKTDFEYAITTSQNIDEDYHEIPPMLIQPFVENAMKHGLLHKTGDKKLTVHFDLSPNEDFLICIITDNGIGRKASAAIKEKSAIKHESFSTQSIAQRLDILKKDDVVEELVLYNDILDKHNLVIGTSVVVKIPIGE